MQALLVSQARKSQIPNSSHLYRVVSHDSSSVLLVHRLVPAIRQRVSRSSSNDKCVNIQDSRFLCLRTHCRFLQCNVLARLCACGCPPQSLCEADLFFSFFFQIGEVMFFSLCGALTAAVPALKGSSERQRVHAGIQKHFQKILALSNCLRLLT